jgi:hypothetical protein
MTDTNEGGCDEAVATGRPPVLARPPLLIRQQRHMAEGDHGSTKPLLHPLAIEEISSPAEVACHPRGLCLSSALLEQAELQQGGA